MLLHDLAKRLVDIEQKDWKLSNLEDDDLPFISRQHKEHIEQHKKTNVEDSSRKINEVFTFFREGKFITHTFASKMLFFGIMIFFLISMLITSISPQNSVTTINPTNNPNVSIGLNANNISEIAKNYATCIAVIIGGFWAYLTFIRKREKYPSADIRHTIMNKRLDDNRMFLKVIVGVNNRGATVMNLDRRLVRIQQMIPWPTEALGKIDHEVRKDTEVEWPLLGEVDLSGKEQEYEIEPGESDEFHFDFIIDSKIKSVVVYSYIRNHKKRDREIGWNKTTVYDIK